jgi:hypothetical protein
MKLQDSKSKKLQSGKTLLELGISTFSGTWTLGFGTFAQRRDMYAPLLNVSKASRMQRVRPSS